MIKITVKDILIEARKLIENDEKWVKGRNHLSVHGLYNITQALEKGKLNAMTASQRLVNSNFDDVVSLLSRSDKQFATQKYHEAIAALEKKLPVKYGSLGEFSNAPETTHDDVIKLFDFTLEELGVVRF